MDRLKAKIRNESGVLENLGCHFVMSLSNPGIPLHQLHDRVDQAVVSKRIVKMSCRRGTKSEARRRHQQKLRLIHTKTLCQPNPAHTICNLWQGHAVAAATALQVPRSDHIAHLDVNLQRLHRTYPNPPVWRMQASAPLLREQLHGKSRCSPDTRQLATLLATNCLKRRARPQTCLGHMPP